MIGGSCLKVAHGGYGCRTLVVKKPLTPGETQVQNAILSVKVKADDASLERYTYQRRRKKDMERKRPSISEWP